MKITKSQLVKIIQEEINNVTEGVPAGDEFGDVKMDENMGDYYDPRQSGGHHDQPKTSNMQLARQCKEGDQAACKMLKKRLGKK